MVIGASSGLGAALATQLLGDGRRVLMSARRLERLQTVASAGRSEGAAPICCRSDLRDREDLTRLADAICSIGPIGTIYLVAAANEPIGGSGADEVWATTEDYLRLMLTSYVCLITSLEACSWLDRESTVVYISSIAAGVEFASLPLYGSMKAAMEHWIRSTRDGGRARRVVVRPGRFESEFFGPLSDSSRVPIELAATIISAVESGRDEIHLGGPRDRVASHLQLAAKRLAARLVRDASPERSDT